MATIDDQGHIIPDIGYKPTHARPSPLVNWWSVPTSSPTPPRPCEHCYCEQVHCLSGLHKKCCNCGNQQAV